MKRKSTLILVFALILAIAVPVFALAAGGPRSAGTAGTRYAQNQIGEGVYAPQGNQFAFSNYQVDENGYCYFLDENGDPQRVYSRNTDGEPLYLQLRDGEYCWSDGTPLSLNTQTQPNSGFGGRGNRWN